MLKLDKKCPCCPGNNVKFVNDRGYYKVVCPDCGTSVEMPKRRKKLSGGGHKLRYGVIR